LSENNSPDTVAVLRQLFGDNRAEWASVHFKDLFVAPTYLKKLESMRPCFLVGGRGTGKTTSLQSLRYDSILERLEAQGLGFADQEYLGVLVRMNKNRVRAFEGSNIPKEQWAKLFAHYFNLLVCLEMSEMALWLQSKTGLTLDTTSVSMICSELGLAKVDSLVRLQDAIKSGISSLQLQVNNPTKDFGIVLSMAESPLRQFSQILSDSNLLGEKVIFCCIDEYENLLDDQQAIINTYIKHAENPLSYKVGVRKNGLRNRQTLDGQDLLKTPDDYAEIEIADEGFDYFAEAVADVRLRYAKKQGVNVPESLKEFLNELSFTQEADLLGAERIADGVLKELQTANDNLHAFFAKKPKAESYFLRYWQESEGVPLLDLARQWRDNEQQWETRFGNYGYASLFWLSNGNKGARIHKYYCGQRILLSLAAGNIRYFLELIDTAIGHELDSDARHKGFLTISPKSQTLAARDVGKRRLNQLEGLADHGVQLKRLVLAIGKVFFELARSPNGKAPEVTSFVLIGNEGDVARVQSLLSEGVGHLAFEADPRTKPTSNAEMRDDEYRLHRIFSAFFEISHRKKRRMSFDAKDLLGVLDDRPSKAISALLENRSQSTEQELPEQLAFFSAFYDGDSKL
jgi:hypothetical protein